VARIVDRAERDTRRKWRLKSRERSVHTATPRTLLPRASSGGENTPMPSCPGKTAMMPPATPLFAGMPTAYTHSPAKSYMPQVVITLSTLSTTRWSTHARRSAGARRRWRVSRHEREVAAVDQDRALAEVEVERSVRVVGQYVEVPEHVADRAIPMSGLLLRTIDRVVDLEPPAGVHREHGEQALEAILGRVARYERRRRDRPGVDHRFNGQPVPGFRLIELNASPLGSTPTFASTRS